MERSCNRREGRVNLLRGQIKQNRDPRNSGCRYIFLNERMYLPLSIDPNSKGNPPMIAFLMAGVTIERTPLTRLTQRITRKEEGKKIKDSKKL